ncbi:hypothetical protein [Teredinibacter sp. KSP-S5-2]|uniref:hypothetical protein n=1 Tax=Teredinibacter sp. KSP-S5-2 TaxID=3034506 RepID=UPI002934BCB5|nr:hypothetical protein [Teredinibacter sp. KSP-S5-2]WNO10323.1 hypothetical protein P5V12_03965 [Teredinibacter sp. KSP-S5-2]
MAQILNQLLPSTTGGFILWFLTAVVVLYFSRSAAHQAIRALFGSLYSGLRLGSVALVHARKQLRERNRDVLLNLGREHTERDLEKEFFEISKFVQKDLGGYPQLQRQISEQISQIQDDYEQSKEVPMAAPDWVDAVEAVSKIKNTDNNPSLNSKILEQIHQSVQQQYKENLEAYREEKSARNKSLKTMTPYWRKLAYSVDEVGVRLKEIVTRSQNIDMHMEKFDEIVHGTDKAEQSLKASAITQFLIASIVIAIAAGGAFFNFHLIALPMSEMVGSLQRIGGVKVADLAALVIICLEVTAGIFLLESLRITKLFPLIGSMDDKVRRFILYAAASVLLILAGTEAALAFMRDQIAGDLAALRASLSGSEATQVHSGGINEWIPLTANMILGFVLPLALTMVAIPLEYMLQTGRTVIGGLLEWVLNSIAVVLRVVATTVRYTGKVVIHAYDILIAAPLWIESMVLKRTQQTRTSSEQDEFASYQDTTSRETARGRN